MRVKSLTQTNAEAIARDHVARIPGPVISDGFSKFTLGMIALSVLLPMLLVVVSRSIGDLIPDRALGAAGIGVIYATYAIRTLATFGALWAFLGVVRWLAAALIKRQKPLGHAALVLAGGVVGLWFIPAALISLPLSHPEQIALGTFTCMLMLVLAQLGSGRWPQVTQVPDST